MRKILKLINDEKIVMDEILALFGISVWILFCHGRSNRARQREENR